MSNILELFIGDLKSIKSNAISVFVVAALILVPALCCWFATLGLWNPTGSAGNLEVALVNTDEGYKSDLLSSRINAGEEVVGRLNTTDRIKWVLTDEQDAKRGVTTGEYYGAVVIPEQFSANLMNGFTDAGADADVVFYTSQAEGQGSTQVVDADANSAEAEINQSFNEATSAVTLDIMADLMDFLDSDGLADYAYALSNRLVDVVGKLDEAALQTQTFAALTGSTSSLVKVSTDILNQMSQTNQNVTPRLDEAQSGLTTGTDALTSATDLGSLAFEQANQGFASIESSLGSILGQLQSAPAQGEASLQNVSTQLSSLTTAYQTMRSSIAAQNSKDPLIADIDGTIAQLGTLQQSITAALNDIRLGSDVSNQTSQDIEGSAQQAHAQISSLQTAYQDQLKNESSQLVQTLNSTKGIANELNQQIESTTTFMVDSTNSLVDNLTKVQQSLEGTSRTLSESSAGLVTVNDQLQAALATDNMAMVRQIIGTDPQRISEYISAVTQLDRKAVFSTETNGSAVSPFYTALAIWVGSLLMVLLMDVICDRKRQESLELPPIPRELYVGRYLIFLMLALIQATIICLGNVLFLNIQCEQLFLYLVSGWVTALVFSNVIYTLVFALGNIGKAIAIVMLLLQVIGSGGVFSLVLSTHLAQVLHQILPVTQSMAAFQSCMVGFVPDEFWTSIAYLLVMIVPMLVLGLFVGKPLTKLNRTLEVEFERIEL